MEHYLYTIELIVQNLKVTKPNECAPSSFPYNVEFRFRKGLYVSIHEKDISSAGRVVKTSLQTPPRDNFDPSKGFVNRDNNETGRLKQGRGCAFVLDRNVDDSDVLDIRLCKKSSDKCKFLIGMAQIPLERQFQLLMEKFHNVNSVQFYESPKLRSVFNEKNKSISPLTPFPYSEGRGTTEAAIEERKTKTEPPEYVPNFKSKAENDDLGIHTDETPFQPDKPAVITFKASVQLRTANGEGSAFIVILVRLTCMGRSLCTIIPYPKSEKKDDEYSDVPTNNYEEIISVSKFAKTSSEISTTGSSHKAESLTTSSSYISSEGAESVVSIPVIEAKVDTSAYDEFEADLNGCGLAIRVLKNSHKVSAVRRYQDPSSCNECKSGGDQKNAIAKLLQLVCRVLMSLNSDEGQSASPCQTSNNPKPPTMQQICRCIQQMLGPPKGGKCGSSNGSHDSVDSVESNRMLSSKRNGRSDPCKTRSRGGSECDSQRNIMLFLQSIRQVVANKKGLSDLTNLLMQCVCEDGSNGGGDNKSGFATVLTFILEKIKNCADENPSIEKQKDLFSLERTLAEIQSTGRNPRIRAGKNHSCSSGSTGSSIQTSENISFLVKKILELGVKYCSNRNMNLRNVLCKILSDDVCNKELTNICRTIGQYLESDRNVVCDHVRKETGGRVVNSACLPPVRGNIKYPSNKEYENINFVLPSSQGCDGGNVDQYRRKYRQRECCVQIDGPDIDNTMQGINQKLPAGIEICRKGTMDLDSDVFILKMGKKGETSHKKGLIEIELRTPKVPSGNRPQLASIATQVDEEMLKERVTSISKDEKDRHENGKAKGKGGRGKGKKEKGRKKASK